MVLAVTGDVVLEARPWPRGQILLPWSWPWPGDLWRWPWPRESIDIQLQSQCIDNQFLASSSNLHKLIIVIIIN